MNWSKFCKVWYKMKTNEIKTILYDYINKHRASRQFRLPAERVLAKELGYSRATIGKVLGTLEGEGLISRKRGAGTFISEAEINRSMTIALVMRNAYHCSEPHFKLIVDNVLKCAEEYGIYVQIFDRLIDMFNGRDEDNQLLKAIDSGLINGILFASRMPVSVISRLVKKVPVSAINNIFGDGSELPCISCDYFQAGFMGAKYLLDKGHRRIAYLTTDISHIESHFELSGIKAAYRGLNESFDTRSILNTSKDMSYFEKYVINFFTGYKYTACFVRSESNARKLVSVLRSINIDVPEDVSIVSVGNYLVNNHHSLGLTVVDNHLDTMARYGVENIIKLVKGESIEKQILLLEPDIIERDSVIEIKQK